MHNFFECVYRLYTENNEFQPLICLNNNECTTCACAVLRICARRGERFHSSIDGQRTRGVCSYSTVPTYIKQALRGSWFTCSTSEPTIFICFWKVGEILKEDSRHEARILYYYHVHVVHVDRSCACDATAARSRAVQWWIVRMRTRSTAFQYWSSLLSIAVH